MNNEPITTNNEPEALAETPSHSGRAGEGNCPHENTHVLTLGFYATCEVTAIFCQDCGKRLSDELWDC